MSGGRYSTLELRGRGLLWGDITGGAHLGVGVQGGGGLHKAAVAGDGGAASNSAARAGRV